MVKRGLSHGQGDATTSEGMLRNILLGNYLLWVAMKDGGPVAGIVLSVRPTDTGSKVWIEMLAGNNSRYWADELEELLSDFMRLTGSRCIEASCRPGLVKILEGRGWRKKAVVMELK